jgi:DNA-binding MarR family transcriptional regulator
MQQDPATMVTKIRSASRDLVRELGFMGRTIAGTDLPPSAVHTLVEIGAAVRLSARELSEKLLLEKSTVSRLVKTLVDRGELREVRSEEDARVKYLHLTGRGEKTLDAITRFAERQVGTAVGPLDPVSRQAILTGLASYSAALRATRLSGETAVAGDRATIEEGYSPGLIGRIVEMHASYYSRLVGFGAVFETLVASGLANFTPRLGNPGNAIWHVRKDGRIVGGIAIDGESLGRGLGLLRWFIVEDGMRGAGIGKALMGEAMAFCDRQGFRETHLWTFKGLDAARRLYENHGFSLVEEFNGDRYGVEVLEQRFVRPRRL